MASNWRPTGAPSPPAPLPRCAGERGEFDPGSQFLACTPNCHFEGAPRETCPISGPGARLRNLLSGLGNRSKRPDPAAGSRLDERHRTGARRGPLSPGPSPPLRGRKGRIRARFTVPGLHAPLSFRRSAARNLPDLRTRRATEKSAFRTRKPVEAPRSRGRISARRTASNWRPQGAPPRSYLAEWGEFDRASTVLARTPNRHCEACPTTWPGVRQGRPDYSWAALRYGAPLMLPRNPSRPPPTSNPCFVISYSRNALLCWLPRIFATVITFLIRPSDSQ
jgi:hypothetical protein